MTHLLEKTWEKGAGDEGESVYGLNEDFRPLVVGDGMSCVAVAITQDASPRAGARRDGTVAAGLCMAVAVSQAAAWLRAQRRLAVRKAERSTTHDAGSVRAA